MKKIFKNSGLLSCFIALLFTSCDSFLTETPESTYTTETFFTKESDFKYAINNLLNVWSNTSYEEGYCKNKDVENTENNIIYDNLNKEDEKCNKSCLCCFTASI